MPEQRRINKIQRSLSRPLTDPGRQRKLFFFAMCLGAATFNLLDSLLGGLPSFRCSISWHAGQRRPIHRFCGFCLRPRAYARSTTP